MNGVSDLVIIVALALLAVVVLGVLLLVFKARGSRPLVLRFQGMGIRVSVGPTDHRETHDSDT